MKHKNNFRLLLLAIFASTIFSCNNEPFDFEENAQTKNEDPEFSVLGKKKEIPFSVENMQKAYKSLMLNKTASQYPIDNIQLNKSSSKTTTGSYQISTTHYYIKFNPQDSLQYNKIINDTILAVSDIPFEYNVDVEGAKYQDPELSGTDFTYYYAVVPKDYLLPNDVPYENIANLHFTDEDNIEESAPELELKKVDFYHDLNLEALKISGNLELEEKQELQYISKNAIGIEEKITYQEAEEKEIDFNQLIINFDEEDYALSSRFFRRRSWSPSGTITVHEDAINQNVGVMGARVRVRKWGWLVIRRATTNRNGYFRTSSTRTKRVKYALYFKHNPYFTVKAGTTFWNARDRGTRTHKRSSWNRHYTYGVRQFYAFIQNAAYDYYTRIINEYGLSHPGYFKRIVGKNWYHASSHALNDFGSTFAFYNIRITIGSNGSYRGSDGIYATTIHELTHLGHLNMDRGMFSIFEIGSNNRLLLKESWAEGVETIVTNDRYSSLDPNYFNSSNDNIGWNFFRQRDRVFEMNEYTSIVSDLIDDYNQAVEYAFLNPDPPIDRVENYTLNQIQNALDNCRNINCWESKLNNNRPTGVTTAELNELFNYVREVRNNSSNW